MPSPETFAVPSLSETFRKRSHTVPAPSPSLKRRWSGILVNISSYFPDFLGFPATLIAAAIDFFHLFSFFCVLSVDYTSRLLLYHF
ncbi:hypothetical protein Bca4012_074116 [Brassica carinata]